MLLTIFLIIVILIVGHNFHNLNLINYIQEIRGTSTYEGEDVPREKFFIITNLITPVLFFIFLLYFSVQYYRKKRN